MGGANAHYDVIKAFSETDRTDDLKALTVPTLVLHGEDEQIVPIADAAHKSVKLLQNGTIKTDRVVARHGDGERRCTEHRPSCFVKA